MVTTYQMFSIPCIIIECTKWNEQKKKLNSLYKSSKFDSESGLSTDYYLQKNDREFSYLENIKEIFDSELKKFESLIFPSAKHSNNFNITGAWFEAAKFGAYHTYHTHGAIGYSAVCYIDYDKNEHDSTHFVAPYFNFLTGEDILFSVSHIKEGMILFFPSCVAHFTQPNLSKKVRRVLSFNMRVPSIPN